MPSSDSGPASPGSLAIARDDTSPELARRSGLPPTGERLAKPGSTARLIPSLRSGEPLFPVGLVFRFTARGVSRGNRGRSLAPRERRRREGSRRTIEALWPSRPPVRERGPDLNEITRSGGARAQDPEQAEATATSPPAASPAARTCRCRARSSPPGRRSARPSCRPARRRPSASSSRRMPSTASR